MIDAKKIEEWKAALEQSTPGPWKIHEYRTAITGPGFQGPSWEDPSTWIATADRSPGIRDRDPVPGVVASSCDGCGPIISERDSALILAAPEAIHALLAEREEMLSVLREVEWVEGDDWGRYCPACGGYHPDTTASWLTANTTHCWLGHAPDCRLAALLGSRT